MEAQDITLEGEAMRLVLYGNEGTGKTTLAMTFPRPLVIDTDGGLISVTYAAGGTVPGTRMEPHGYRNVEDIVKFVRANLDNIDTIIIDDISTLCDDLIDELTAEHAKAERHKTRPLLMESVPERIEYLGNQQQIRRLLQALRQTGKHVVVIASMRVADKESGEPGRHQLDVSPKTQKIIGKWSSVMGELVADEFTDIAKGVTSRVLYTEPSSQRQAKSRFAPLRPVVVNPTFDILWEPIKGLLPEPETNEQEST